MIQFSSTKDTSTSYQGLAALETMPGPIGVKAQESPVEGGSGSKILEANFGATVVAETGSLPYRNEAVPFNRCCSSCETILCVCCWKTETGVWGCWWTTIQQEFHWSGYLDYIHCFGLLAALLEEGPAPITINIYIYIKLYYTFISLYIYKYIITYR